ncbi:pilus assembly protein TadG-related protein [uncultured Halovibrio sp.]|uniref:pilus assembly protein TadG-related protein n=1 Tax=uncultured Halovibrio sp. TaxID=985049 RepID=UPI0025D4F2E4|nr:pilus assembly protein TadG-related protein [uncultured Halovibrio sp.]
MWGRSACSGQRLARLSEQEGAISVLAASALTLSLVMLALAVDSARLFYQDSRVQGAADAAAVAAVTRYTEADPGEASRMQAALDAAETVVERSLKGGGRVVDLELGRVLSKGGMLEFEPDSTGMAVRVNVERETPMSLIAGWVFPDDAVLRADAVAEQPQLIELQAGSGLASFDSGDSALLNALLGGLLGTDLSLDLVTYQGLADADIRLVELVEARAGVGSVEELLDTRIGLGELIDLVVAAAPDQTSAIVQLGSVAAQVDPQLDLRLGDVLKVGLPTEEAAANVGLNALSLIRLGAQAANKGQAVELDLGSEVLDEVGVADLDVSLALGEPPQIAIGRAGKTPQGSWRTQVETGQVELGVKLEALSLLGPIAELETDLNVDLANGTAWAERLWLENDGPRVRVGAQSEAGNLQLALKLKLLGVNATQVDAEVPIGNASDPKVFAEPFGSSYSKVFGGDLGDALSNDLLSQVEVELLGLELPGLDNLSVVTNLLGNIVSVVVDPLLEVLGVQAGIAEVSVNQVRAGTPRLVH